MSAFLVSHTHIAAIVRYAMAQRSLGGDLRIIDYDHADRTCELLAAENVRSVKYRYPNDSDAELPGPCDGSIAVRPSFKNFTYSRTPDLRPVEVLKAIDCLVYQSCEHPEWDQSTARKWLDGIRHTASTKVQGYDAAGWDIPDPAPDAPTGPISLTEIMAKR